MAGVCHFSGKRSGRNNRRVGTRVAWAEGLHLSEVSICLHMDFYCVAPILDDTRNCWVCSSTILVTKKHHEFLAAEQISLADGSFPPREWLRSGAPSDRQRRVQGVGDGSPNTRPVKHLPVFYHSVVKSRSQKKTVLH